MTTETPFTESDLDYGADAVGLADFDIRTDYSGRGMYGATCLGIVHDHADAPLIGLVIYAAIMEHRDDPGLALEDAADIVRRAQTDSMGLQTITYFPGYTLAEGVAS